MREYHATIKVVCPNCVALNIMPPDGWEDLEEVGKHVMVCGECGHFILIRDDGDGPFVCTH